MLDISIWMLDLRMEICTDKKSTGISDAFLYLY